MGKLTAAKLDQAVAVLSQTEQDMARSEWRQLKRPGVKYVDAGVLEDGTVELVHDDEAALKSVSDAILTAGRKVKRYRLPELTAEDFGTMYSNAIARGGLRTLKTLTDGEPSKKLKGR